MADKTSGKITQLSSTGVLAKSRYSPYHVRESVSLSEDIRAIYLGDSKVPSNNNVKQKEFWSKVYIAQWIVKLLVELDTDKSTELFDHDCVLCGTKKCTKHSVPDGRDSVTLTLFDLTVRLPMDIECPDCGKIAAEEADMHKMLTKALAKCPAIKRMREDIKNKKPFTDKSAPDIKEAVEYLWEQANDYADKWDNAHTDVCEEKQDDGCVEDDEDEDFTDKKTKKKDDDSSSSSSSSSDGE